MSTIDRLSDLAPERVRPLRRVEYEKLVADGVFEDERVELLGGVIVEMSPQDVRHAGTIELLTSVLLRLASGRVRVRAQLPFAASDHSMPEPDVALCPAGDPRTSPPGTPLLVVEVSHASLRKDRVVKGEVYARAGVPEYWIVNLVDRCVEIHTGPHDGGYANVTLARPGDSLSIAALDGAKIAVDDFLC